MHSFLALYWYFDGQIAVPFSENGLAHFHGQQDKTGKIVPRMGIPSHGYDYTCIPSVGRLSHPWVPVPVLLLLKSAKSFSDEIRKSALNRHPFSDTLSRFAFTGLGASGKRLG